MRGTKLTVLAGVLALGATSCCEKKAEVPPPVQPAPAAAPVQVAPPQIDYDKLATMVADKIDTDAMVNKVVDKLKADKLVGQAKPEVPAEALRRVRPDLAAASKDKPAPAARAMVDNTVWKVTLRGDEPMRGAKEALVTMVLFSDYQCPFCKRVEPTMEQVLEKYGETVRLVWKNNPLAFHKNARIAAQATCAAGVQGKFWELHKVLFENMQKLEKEDLLGYAKNLGLDMTRFEADFGSDACAKAIDDDQRLAGEVGARGTPNIYINGRQARGALPFEQIEPIIQEELAKAKALVEKGTAAAAVYDEIVKAGKTFTPLDAQVFEFKAPAPFKGPADAPVVLTIFSDFQCPFCSRLTKTQYEVFNLFPGKVKLEFRNFPLSFHKDAHLAAQAAMAADAEGKFWEMHDKLFENQKALTRPDLEKFATEIGLNLDKFKKALDEGTFKAAVDAQMKEGEAAGVRGTPSIYLNGRKFQAQDREIATFKKIIESEILSKI